MPPSDTLALKLLASHTEASRWEHVYIEALREVARSDQALAKIMDAKERHFSSLQKLVAISNEYFAHVSQHAAILNESWNSGNAHFDEAQESWVIEDYRYFLENSSEAPLSIESFASEGRPIEGAELFKENALKARALIEDYEIRKQAERTMPSLNKLDALADAHLRSIGD